MDNQKNFQPKAQSANLSSMTNDKKTNFKITPLNRTGIIILLVTGILEIVLAVELVATGIMFGMRFFLTGNQQFPTDTVNDSPINGLTELDAGLITAGMGIAIVLALISAIILISLSIRTLKRPNNHNVKILGIMGIIFGLILGIIGGVLTLIKNNHQTNKLIKSKK